MNQATRCEPRRETQRVVVVNGGPSMLDVLSRILDADRYDLAFVDAGARAYSQIKRTRPHLIILCAELDDPDAFTVLSMLKLDEETRRIPVVTYAITDQDSEGKDEPRAADLIELPAEKPLRLLN